MICGRSSDTTYEQTEMWKPGKHLLGDRGAAEHVPALEHEHAAAGARQIRRVCQSVVAAADHDYVVLGIEIPDSRFQILASILS